MNIWLLSPFSPLPKTDAHESRTATLARVLVNAGHRVEWFSSDFDHRTKEHVHHSALISPATIHLIPTPRYAKNISFRRFLSHWIWGRRLVRIARRSVQKGELEKPDLILASSPPLDAPKAAFQLRATYGCPVKIDLTDLWPYTFERIFKVPCLSGFDKWKVTGRSSHTCVPEPHAQHTFFLRPLYRMGHTQWRLADGVSAMSREYLDELLRVAPEQDTHLCYIGGTILPHVPRPRPEAASPCVSFLYLGALTDSYDFPTLFAACEILLAEGVPFHIHIAGSGPQEHELQDRVRNSTLASCVTFHGFLHEQDMFNLCTQSDVGLNIIRPGLHITMPHKLNDYLCAGLPILNSLQGEAANLLDTYHAGITYTPGDPDSLKAAMHFYIKKRNAPQSGAQTAARELLDRRKTYPEWAEWLVS